MANSKRIARSRGTIRTRLVGRCRTHRPYGARIVATAIAAATATFARMEHDTIQTSIAVREKS